MKGGKGATRGSLVIAPLVRISGKPLEFVCQTTDALLYISRAGCHPENSNLGPAGLSGVAPEWHDLGILGGYVSRLCNRASPSIYIRILRRFFLSLARPFFSPFRLSFSFSLSCSWREPHAHLYSPDTQCSYPCRSFSELATSFPRLTYRPIVELLYVAILNQIKTRRFLSCVN